MNINLIEIILALIGGLGLGFFLGWVISSKFSKNKIAVAIEKAAKIIDDAEKDAKHLKKEKLLEVKDEWLKKKQDFDNEVNQKRQKQIALEKQLEQREDSLEKKYELVTQKEKSNKESDKKIAQQNEEINRKNAELDRLILENNDKLEKVAGLSSDEAKKILMENMIAKARTDAAQQLKEVRETAKLEAKKESQKIVVQAIQRTAVDHSVESTVSVVQIQNDEMKGRIIGREGRNIRAFEAATGVDVIVDDTPEAVILSAF